MHVYCAQDLFTKDNGCKMEFSGWNRRNRTINHFCTVHSALVNIIQSLCSTYSWAVYSLSAIKLHVHFCKFVFKRSDNIEELERNNIYSCSYAIHDEGTWANGMLMTTDILHLCTDLNLSGRAGHKVWDNLPGICWGCDSGRVTGALSIQVNGYIVLIIMRLGNKSPTFHLRVLLGKPVCNRLCHGHTGTYVSKWKWSTGNVVGRSDHKNSKRAPHLL